MKKTTNRQQPAALKFSGPRKRPDQQSPPETAVAVDPRTGVPLSRVDQARVRKGEPYIPDPKRPARAPLWLLPENIELPPTRAGTPIMPYSQWAAVLHTIGIKPTEHLMYKIGAEAEHNLTQEESLPAESRLAAWIKERRGKQSYADAYHAPIDTNPGPGGGRGWGQFPRSN